MNLVATLLAPFLLLFPAAGASEEEESGSGRAEASANVVSLPAGDWSAPEWSTSTFPQFRPDDAQQVRIEQRMTIRITPRAMLPLPPEMLADLRGQPSEPHFRQRKIGKCLPIAGIVGSRPGGSGSLILLMRDRRIINAELDRTCRARDFYSGFYLAPSQDGMICVDRDTLLSRSGANCKLSRIRQLVEMSD